MSDSSDDERGSGGSTINHRYLDRQRIGRSDRVSGGPSYQVQFVARPSASGDTSRFDERNEAESDGARLRAVPFGHAGTASTHSVGSQGGQGDPSELELERDPTNEAMTNPPRHVCRVEPKFWYINGTDVGVVVTDMRGDVVDKGESLAEVLSHSNFGQELGMMARKTDLSQDELRAGLVEWIWGEMLCKVNPSYERTVQAFTVDRDELLAWVESTHQDERLKKDALRSLKTKPGKFTFEPPTCSPRFQRDAPDPEDDQ